MPQPTQPTPSEEPTNDTTEPPVAPPGGRVIDNRLGITIAEELIGHFAQLQADDAFSEISWIVNCTNMLYEDGCNKQSLERAAELALALEYLVMRLLSLSTDPEELRERVCRHYDEEALPDLRNQPFIVLPHFDDVLQWALEVDEAFQQAEEMEGLEAPHHGIPDGTQITLSLVEPFTVSWATADEALVAEFVESLDENLAAILDAGVADIPSDPSKSSDESGRTSTEDGDK